MVVDYAIKILAVNYKSDEGLLDAVSLYIQYKAGSSTECGNY
jgi:hypothetical protein